jgi:hypothetical protein
MQPIYYIGLDVHKKKIKQVDFRFGDHELRGLEQNLDTKSKWDAMAREGEKVRQFLDGGRGRWEDEDLRLRAGAACSQMGTVFR